MALKDWRKVGRYSWKNKNKKLYIIKESYGLHNFYILRLNKEIIIEHHPGSSESIMKLKDIIDYAKSYMRKH